MDFLFKQKKKQQTNNKWINNQIKSHCGMDIQNKQHPSIFFFYWSSSWTQALSDLDPRLLAIIPNGYFFSFRKEKKTKYNIWWPSKTMTWKRPCVMRSLGEEVVVASSSLLRTKTNCPVKTERCNIKTSKLGPSQQIHREKRREKERIMEPNVDYRFLLVSHLFDVV